MRIQSTADCDSNDGDGNDGNGDDGDCDVDCYTFGVTAYFRDHTKSLGFLYRIYIPDLFTY